MRQPQTSAVPPPPQLSGAVQVVQLPPLVPQAASSSMWQVPAPSQQPVGQLVPSQTQAPPTQRWPLGQPNGVPPPHVPLLQVLPVVQRSPSSQGVSSATIVHCPLPVSQVWQTGQAPQAHGSQETGVPQVLLTVPQRPAQVSAGDSGWQGGTGSD